MGGGGGWGGGGWGGGIVSHASAEDTRLSFRGVRGHDTQELLEMHYNYQ